MVQRLAARRVAEDAAADADRAVAVGAGEIAAQSDAIDLLAEGLESPDITGKWSLS